MIRTQVYLPDDMHRDLKLLSITSGMNFSQLIREGVKVVVKKKTTRKKKDFGKGFFGAGGTKGPKDLSSKIDYYLYGGGSEWAKK